MSVARNNWGYFEDSFPSHPTTTLSFLNLEACRVFSAEEVLQDIETLMDAEMDATDVKHRLVTNYVVVEDSAKNFLKLSGLI